MNIFVLHTDPRWCAIYHCDQHVVNQIKEYAQILSTAVRITTGQDIGYKPTHINHRCNVWVRESLANFNWLRRLASYLNREWRYRYNHTERNHASYDVIRNLPTPSNIPDIGMTPFKLAMDEEYICDDPVLAYRRFYVYSKVRFATWRRRYVPYWFMRGI